MSCISGCCHVRLIRLQVQSEINVIGLSLHLIDNLMKKAVSNTLLSGLLFLCFSNAIRVTVTRVHPLLKIDKVGIHNGKQFQWILPVESVFKRADSFASEFGSYVFIYIVLYYILILQYFPR